MSGSQLEPISLSRREFVRSAGLLAAVGPFFSDFPIMGAQGATGAITEVSLDLNCIKKWDDSNGDTWDPFWADDGALYSFNCDGRGFGVKPQNLAFNAFSGNELVSITGSQVNPMSEYGPSGQRGPDIATWKVCGQECIDGVFYAFVARNVYGDQSHDPLMRQTASNSSLIKSEDRGKTWTRSAGENYSHPMWPGERFGAPFFVHYGQNGGQVHVDGAEEFVYAVATNGFWNDGDFLVLGRVRRIRIARLDPSDWEYYRGGDGTSAASWSGNVYETTPILARPARCGQTPITWVPALGRYLLISWYNPEPLAKWYQPTEMRYDFYVAEYPWGPWSPLASFSDRFLAPGYNMYGPSLCAKYQVATRDEVVVPMFTAGCQFEDKPTGIYKCWMIPVLFRTAPLPAHTPMRFDDPSIHRDGNWSLIPASEGRDNAALQSSHPGDALEVSFEGTGIEYLARKAAGYGNVTLLLDGKPDATVALGTRNFPEISGVSVYRKLDLQPSHHLLRLINVGADPVNLQAVNVYR